MAAKKTEQKVHPAVEEMATATKNVIKHVNSIIGQVAFTSVAADGIAKLTLVPACMSYVLLKQAQEALNEAAKNLSEIRRSVQYEHLPKVFEREGAESTAVVVDGRTYRVTPTEALRVSIKGEKKSEAYEWLRGNGLESLITETVNASTLSAAVKERMAENKGVPEDMFNVLVQPSVSVTAVKK